LAFFFFFLTLFYSPSSQPTVLFFFFFFSLEWVSACCCVSPLIFLHLGRILLDAAVFKNSVWRFAVNSISVTSRFTSAIRLSPFPGPPPIFIDPVAFVAVPACGCCIVTTALFFATRWLVYNKSRLFSLFFHFDDAFFRDGLLVFPSLVLATWLIFMASN